MKTSSESSISSTSTPEQSTVEELPGPAAVLPLKKQSSLRSIFSVFRKPKNAHLNTDNARKPSSFRSRISSFSTTSLPSQVRKPSPYPPETKNIVYGSQSDHRAGLSSSQSATSLPSQIRPPFAYTTSSSSSASSLEFPSDTSTATTSPSNSSQSVVIKSASSGSLSTMGNEEQRDTSPTRGGKKSKRNTENFKKHPSPLSTVTDAQGQYKMPTPPQSPVIHERRNSFQPERRRSVTSLFLRRSQSHPDFADFTGDLPPLPPLPTSAPSSRPTSASSAVPRKLTLRRKSSSKKLADLETPTSYSPEEKIEHRSILGADPVGVGFYLYPKPQEDDRRQSFVANGPYPRFIGENGRRSSWSGMSDSSRLSARRIRDSRSKSFRSNFSQQVIEEEAVDMTDTNSDSKKSSPRRFSEGYDRIPVPEEPVPPIPALCGGQPVFPSIDGRLEEGENSSRESLNSGGSVDSDSYSTMSKRSSPKEIGFDIKLPMLPVMNFSRPSTGCSDKQMEAMPAVRVHTVDA